MKSKPNFEIDIVRGNQTLSFTCSYNSEPGASGADDNYSMKLSFIEIINFHLIIQSVEYSWHVFIFVKLIINLWKKKVLLKEVCFDF